MPSQSDHGRTCDVYYVWRVLTEAPLPPLFPGVSTLVAFRVGVRVEEQLAAAAEPQ